MAGLVCLLFFFSVDDLFPHSLVRSERFYWHFVFRYWLCSNWGSSIVYTEHSLFSLKLCWTIRSSVNKYIWATLWESESLSMCAQWRLIKRLAWKNISTTLLCLVYVSKKIFAFTELEERKWQKIPESRRYLELRRLQKASNGARGSTEPYPPMFTSLVSYVWGLRGMDALSKVATLSEMFLPPMSVGVYSRREELAPYGEKVFPFSQDPILDWICCTEAQTGKHHYCFLLKNGGISSECILSP